MTTKLLGTITDKPTLSQVDLDRVHTLKRGAFGLVIKGDQVALIYAQNESHHELPGGSADEGETPMQNFQREILEEVGYNTADCIEIGMIREVWSTNNIETFSTLFVARAIGEPHEVILTEKEVRRGLMLKWLPFAELQKTILSEKPDALMGRMKHGRDVIALRTVGERGDDMLRDYAPTPDADKRYARLASELDADKKTGKVKTFTNVADFMKDLRP